EEKVDHAFHIVTKHSCFSSWSHGDDSCIARLQLRDQGSNSSNEKRRRVAAPPSGFPFGKDGHSMANCSSGSSSSTNSNSSSSSGSPAKMSASSFSSSGSWTSLSSPAGFFFSL